MIRHSANLDDDSLDTEAVRALIAALGFADTARFLRRHGFVAGDYTTERRDIEDARSVEQIVKDIEAWKSEKRN